MWGTAFKLGLGWAGGEYASADKRDNFDNGGEEDDAAHNFKRPDHVLPIEIIFVISSTSSACYKSIITRVKVGREDGLGFWCVVCESEGPGVRPGVAGSGRAVRSKHQTCSSPCSSA